MKSIAIALLAAVLSACATDPAVMKMAIDAQQATKPTIELECPAGGCRLAYVDPRDRQAIKLPTNGFDAYVATLNTAGNLLGAAIVPAAFAYTATRGFDAMRGHGASTTTTNTSNTDNSNRAVTTDNSNRAVTTDSSNRSTSTSSVATTTTTSATDSYNTTTTTDSNNPVSTVTTTTTTNTMPTTTTTTTNPSTTPPVCAIDGAGNLVCKP